jgi:hypothetical protein
VKYKPACPPSALLGNLVERKALEAEIFSSFKKSLPLAYLLKAAMKCLKKVGRADPTGIVSLYPIF